MEDYKEKYEMALERAKEMCAMPSDKATMEYIFQEVKESEDKFEKPNGGITDKPNGGIVLEDFSEGNGFYKVNLAYLSKEQVGEIENIVKKWNPELESEGEKIRKVLIDLVKCNERSGYKLLNNMPTSSMIAWLEKLKDYDKQLEDTYNEGYKAAQAEMERNRLTACEKQTEEEAKREMDFALGFFKKNKRQPTYSDCIEETRRKMIKEVTKWLDDNASRYIHVYWNEKEWVFEKGDLNADLKKSMGL